MSHLLCAQCRLTANARLKPSRSFVKFQVMSTGILLHVVKEIIPNLQQLSDEYLGLGCLVSVQGVAQVQSVSRANLHILQHNFLCQPLPPS